MVWGFCSSLVGPSTCGSTEDLYKMVLSVWSNEFVPKKVPKNYPNFPLQLNQAPPFSREILPCMHNHLVDLDAMQTVYSLQNSFAGVSLNSHRDQL